ncbi:MAG: GMC family oxidoreductase [Ilumatobacteraceae bacterium]
MTTLAAEFVVIGSGSSGCAVAGRLAEAGRDVLLLEAGPDYGAFNEGRWPAELLSAQMLAITHDWGYHSGQWTFERAKVMGGCSSHNGAIAAVGHRFDYDDWNMAGWSGDEVAPLFDAVIERMRVRTYADSEAGPFHRRCLLAATELGWPIASDLCDLDAGPSFGLETVNVVDGVRWNAAFAYVDPVRDRLRIVDRVMVDRIDRGANGTSVIGERNGEQLVVEAGTVVLAAGVYGTPGILERSGIGDPDVLRAAGIDVRHSLPGVGANLHDHSMVEADRVVGPQLQAWLDEAAASGFLPEEQTLGKFVSSASADGRYDMHIYPVCASDQTSALHGRVVVTVACLTPHSRGSVHVTSADHLIAPAIDHRYLSDEAGHDLAVLRDGLVTAQELLNHPQLAEILGEQITDVSSDDAIRRAVRHYYHPVGTCAMGEGSMAVCDSSGRVHGVDGVVVADVCLMPQVPRANTNLPAVMIGERIARTLLQR